MDDAKKMRIDDWVEHGLYSMLSEMMKKNQISLMDAQTVTPLIQMYQAIQMRNLCQEMNDLWRLFVDGDAGITISQGLGSVRVKVTDKVDVNVVEPTNPAQKKKREP